MLIELAAYPLRPIRKAGESLAGFISRHFGTNGHWMPEALHRAIDTLYRSEEAARREEAWQLVTRLIGDAPSEYRYLWLDERFTNSWPWQRGRSWQRVDATYPRVCPSCLDSTGIHFAIWDLPLVDACPVHNCELLKHCHCGRRIAWCSMGPDWTCRCGRPLTTLASRPASARSLILAKSVVAASGLPVPSCTSMVHPRVAGSLVVVYDLVFWLHGLRRLVAERRQEPGKDKGVPTVKVGGLLIDWPHGITRSFMRLLRFRYRRHLSDVLVRVESDSPSGRLLRYLAAGRIDNALPDGARFFATTVLNEIASPVDAPLNVILNPAITVSEQQRRLAVLSAWWQRLCIWIEPLDGEGIGPHTPVPSYFEPYHDKFRIKLLNALIDAAVRGVEVGHFRRLAQVWPPTRHGDNKAPVDLIRSLWQQLTSISSAHLYYLCELASSVPGQVDTDDHR